MEEEEEKEEEIVGSRESKWISFTVVSYSSPFGVWRVASWRRVGILPILPGSSEELIISYSARDVT